jgi:hypothetical protein
MFGWKVEHSGVPPFRLVHQLVRAKRWNFETKTAADMAAKACGRLCRTSLDR